MYLHETIESINMRLERNFGRDVVTGLPNFRVVWSEEQFEYRLGTYEDYTPEGIYLRTVKEVRYVPKYRQWIQEKYVLEGLAEVPDCDAETLPVSKISYEPLWTFEDKKGNPLPPKYEAAEFVLQQVRKQQESGGVKYQEEIPTNEERIARLEEELFGNETPVGDALAIGTGVSLANTQKAS